MYVVDFKFKNKLDNKNNNYLELIDNVLHALRLNGQILGSEFPIVFIDKSYVARIMIPEIDSLKFEYRNDYVKKFIMDLENECVEFLWDVIGHEPYSDKVCKCVKSQSYILYTYYNLIESPIRCGDCFNVIPLYKLPPTNCGEYSDIITWVKDYQACDILQMNCRTGERFGIEQLSNYKSSLSVRGIDICKKVLLDTGIPMYYYLYKIKGKSKMIEAERKCPTCGGDWILEYKLHGLFDFRCEKCKILSNIAWLYR